MSFVDVVERLDCAVTAGQVWSIREPSGRRIEVEIKCIVRGPMGERRARCRTKSGKPRSFPVRTFELGAKGPYKAEQISP